MFFHVTDFIETDHVKVCIKTMQKSMPTEVVKIELNKCNFSKDLTEDRPKNDEI